MAGWIVDKTPLMAIKYDLLRQARVGNAILGILGLNQSTNAFISLLAGGLVNGWLPELKTNGNTGATVRKFQILMLDPVTIEICKRAAAFQMQNLIYKKQSELPYDGVSTPAEWVFNVEYVGTSGIIQL
jgi:hypothetical protein